MEGFKQFLDPRGVRTLVDASGNFQDIFSEFKFFYIFNVLLEALQSLRQLYSGLWQFFLDVFSSF